MNFYTYSRSIQNIKVFLKKMAAFKVKDHRVFKKHRGLLL